MRFASPYSWWLTAVLLGLVILSAYRSYAGSGLRLSIQRRWVLGGLRVTVLVLLLALEWLELDRAERLAALARADRVSAGADETDALPAEYRRLVGDYYRSLASGSPRSGLPGR